MLARIANSLFWMGRYIERSEHLSRYMKEIYFSALDSPLAESSEKNFVLESMMYMNGMFEVSEVEEKSILYYAGMDKENGKSIVSTIISARENARGSRDILSSDLWQAINKYYHYAKDYNSEHFITSGLYEFTQSCIEQSNSIKSKLQSTILQDEVSIIVHLGIHIERALQIIRILNSKLNDIYKLESSGIEVNDLSYEWSTLLRCAESFDMNRKFYRRVPNRNQVLEFLFLNQKCPRSIAHCLSRIEYYMNELCLEKTPTPSSPEFMIGKLSSEYRYLTIEDIEDNTYNWLNHTQNTLVEISTKIEKTYLNS